MRFFSRSRLSLIVLPALYLLLAIFTIFVSATVPGGAYYRIIGVNLVAGMVGMVSEGVLFYSVLLIFGAAWWLLIGAIGAQSRGGGISRPIAALGGLLSLAVALGGAAITSSALDEDLRKAGLSTVGVIQYVLVGMLILAVLFVAFYSARAAVSPVKIRTSR